MYIPTQLSEEELCIKEKLYPILLDTYNKVDGIIASRIKWHVDRFSTREKAEKELLQKYQPQLFNDYYDTNIIIELLNLFQNKKEDEDIIQMLSHEIAYYMSVFCPPSDINVDNEWVKWVINHLTAHEIVRRLKTDIREENEYSFSVSEWGAIFYYADQSNYFDKNLTVNAKIETFMKGHSINTTIKTFRSKYYKVKQEINDHNTFSTNKLKKIIPFLSVHYFKTVTLVNNDIELLLDEQSNR